MQSFSIADRDKFGVTLVLFQCAFSAELQRDSISQVMTEIENQLNESGAPDDNAARVEMMMNNATAISAMVANRQIEDTEGVADIAYSFIYALGKTVGFDQVINLRGLTGTFLQNELSLNPCLGELEYQMETATLQRAMADSDDGNWSIARSSPPTLH
jgi:hypothetical protein